MNKEFVSYEQALALKELGFNEPCFGYYTNNDFQFFADVKSCNTNSEFKFYPTAPTFSQAFIWFREKYKLYPEINLHDRENEESWRFEISVLGDYNLVYNQNVTKEPYYKTYEEAELECLKKLIKIVKTN
jgi:hypothetical protein